ncbi:hypothetical protein MNBD_GAMMA07-195 [hydrothermal vent metagenome]|uniref:Lipoprotein n=1 Tax=hydrothermal vent metagenome TaxID=652676 RepID=A0A3B0X399_9ZZZZ
MEKINAGLLNLSSLFLVLMVLFLSGCGNRYEEQMQKSHQIAKNDLIYLKNELDTSQLTNALLINKYAYALSQQKPDFEDVVMLLKKESTADGKAYKALQKRLNAVNLKPTSQDQANANLNELRLISAAAEPIEYNSMLADVVNTIASLSDGKLPVVNVPIAQQKAAQQSNALIGNPSYGNWNRGSDGRSFWEWYGMYSMFSNVMGGRSYYGGWSSRPHYSYYNNYGRNRWGSSNDVTRNYNLSKKTPSRYNKPSAATKQRYAKASSRSSSFGSSKSRSSTFGSKSSSSSKSRSSSYGSSSRSSSFSSSRSSFSGK